MTRDIFLVRPSTHGVGDAFSLEVVHAEALFRGVVSRIERIDHEALEGRVEP